MKAGQKAAKSEVTRAKIVASALELFEQHGYDGTTMRMVAEKAGVSVGNAYNYFESKEELMQGYYEEIFNLFSAQAGLRLESGGSFAERLADTLTIWTETARPFHDFAVGVFYRAADPRSPLSPFSEASAGVREANIESMRRLIDGSEKLKMADSVRERLPELLWLYLLSVVLFWVYDRTPQQRNTATLIKRTAPLVARMVTLSRLPVLRSSADEVIDIINQLAPRIAGGANSAKAKV